MTGVAPVILCLDPAFRHLGVTVISLLMASEEVVHASVVCTEKQNKKAKVLAADDNHRCSQELAGHLMAVIKQWKPVLICAESMQGSQNSHAALLQGMSWGVVSAVTRVLNIPVLQTTPQTVKKVLCGRKDASKDDIEAAVCKLFPSMVPLAAKIQPASLREHAYDAAAVGYTCLGSTEIHSIRRMAHGQGADQEAGT